MSGLERVPGGYVRSSSSSAALYVRNPSPAVREQLAHYSAALEVSEAELVRRVLERWASSAPEVRARMTRAPRARA